MTEGEIARKGYRCVVHIYVYWTFPMVGYTIDLKNTSSTCDWRNGIQNGVPSIQIFVMLFHHPITIKSSGAGNGDGSDGISCSGGEIASQSSEEKESRSKTPSDNHNDAQDNNQRYTRPLEMSDVPRYVQHTDKTFV